MTVYETQIRTGHPAGDHQALEQIRRQYEPQGLLVQAQPMPEGGLHVRVLRATPSVSPHAPSPYGGPVPGAYGGPVPGAYGGMPGAVAYAGPGGPGVWGTDVVPQPGRPGVWGTDVVPQPGRAPAFAGVGTEEAL